MVFDATPLQHAASYCIQVTVHYVGVGVEFLVPNLGPLKKGTRNSFFHAVSDYH